MEQVILNGIHSFLRNYSKLSDETFLRNFLMLLRIRFDLRTFSLEFLEGFVFCLGFGIIVACRMSIMSLPKASCLFFSWVRNFWDMMIKIPSEESRLPESFIKRSRTGCGIDGEFFTSNRSWTADATLLTF